MPKVKEKFEEYLEYMRKKGRADHTIRIHKIFLYGAASHTSNKWHEKEINQIKATDDAYLAESGATHGKSGPMRTIVVVRQFIKFLRKQGYDVPIEYQDLDVPKCPKDYDPVILEGLDLDNFLEGIMKIGYEDNGLKMRALLELIMSSGLRIGEALALNRKDIEGSEVKVTNIKSGDRQLVYLSDRCKYWIDKWLATRDDNEPALFTDRFGGRWMEDCANDRLRFFRKKMGLKGKIVFTTFRRILSTTLVRNRVDMKAIQTIMRHKDFRTTMNHYVVASRKLAKAYHESTMNPTNEIDNLVLELSGKIGVDVAEKNGRIVVSFDAKQGCG